MKKILVPVDFSPASHNAARYAASMAEVLRADLYLLHAYTEPAPSVDGSTVAINLQQEAIEELKSRLEQEKEFISTNFSVHVQSQLLAGFKSDIIQETAESWNADLIIMGRKITKDKLLFGSTILKTIRKTSIPMLIIPQGTDYTPPKRIVVPVDFENMVYSENVAVLFWLAKQYDAAVTVLHVEKPQPDMKVAEVAGKLQVGRVMSQLNYTYERVENANIEQGILTYVSNHPTDLLAMIAHHHGILERLFGSIHTRSVVMDVKLPFLILKN
jgi:nucleotide-binding universal stress UspA family protein